MWRTTVPYSNLDSGQMEGPRSRCLPQRYCYAVLAAGSVITTGLVGSIWAFCHFSHMDEIPQEESPSFIQRYRTPVLFLGPALIAMGVVIVATVLLSYLYQVRQSRRKAVFLSEEQIQSLSGLQRSAALGERYETKIGVCASCAKCSQQNASNPAAGGSTTKGHVLSEQDAQGQNALYKNSGSVPPEKAAGSKDGITHGDTPQL